MTTDLVHLVPDDVTHTTLTARVAGLIPGIRSRMDEAERLRRLPDATIADLESIDYFRMHVPKRYGGMELNVDTLYETARLLAQGDTSTAWTATFLAYHNTAIARFPLAAQDEVFGDRSHVLSGGSFHALPGSEGRLVDGGMVVTGRWDFCSGILHSDWCFVDVPVAPGSDAQHQSYVCLMPVSELTVHNVWHTTGMKATGSNDVSAQEVFVPSHRMLPTSVFFSPDSPGSEVHPDYVFLKTPFYRVAAIFHAAFVIGSAERALDVFREQIGPKRRRPVNSGTLIESPLTHSRFADAEKEVHIARLLTEWHVDKTLLLYNTGGDKPLADRAYMRLSSVSAIHAAARAVDLITEVSGGSMYRAGSELDRIKRDCNVLRNHNSGDWDFHSETAGKVLLGIPDNDGNSMLYKAL